MSGTTTVVYYAEKQCMLVSNLSITKIVLGLLSVAVGIATCALNSPDIVYYSLNGYIGTGIWCGVISIATGAVGVTAANTNTFIRIISHVTLSLLLAVLSAGQVSLSIYSLSKTNLPCPTFGTSRNISPECRLRNDLMALDVILTLLGVCMLLLSVSAVVVSTKALTGKAIIISDRNNDNQRKMYSKFQKRLLCRIGFTQLALGIGCIIFGTIAVVLNRKITSLKFSFNGDIGSGIWTGVYFTFMGAVLWATACKSSSSKIIASSVMNVIGSMMAILLMIISLISLGDTNQHCPPKSYYGAANYTQCVTANALVASDVMLTIIPLAEFVLTLVTIGISMVVLKRSSREVNHVAARSNSRRPELIRVPYATSNRTERPRRVIGSSDIHAVPSYESVATVTEGVSSVTPVAVSRDVTESLPSYDSLKNLHAL